MATVAALLVLLSQDLEVREVRNLAYYDGEDADRRKHKLDLYLPVQEDPFPIVLWIHGGAWTAGDRSLYGPLGRRFAERGIGLAAISYRLSPAVKHPEHVRDCARAFAWLVANAEKYGGSPERLFVCGQSAGGHLAALLALNRRYFEEQKVAADAIKGAIPMSGVYWIPPVREGRRGPLAVLSKAFGEDPESCRDASPVEHVADCRTPLLVLTESEDTLFLRASMERFRTALREAGIERADFRDAEGRDHISIVTEMFRQGPEPVRDGIVEFVRARCRELDGE